MKLPYRPTGADHNSVAKTAVLLLGATLAAQSPQPLTSTAAALALLRADQVEKRIEALGELAHGDTTAPVFEAVAVMLGDPILEVRCAAVEALLALRKDLRSLRPMLREIVGPREAVQRRGPRIGFGGLVLAGNPAQHLAALGDKDATVRRRAVVALCALGSQSAPHEEEILALLQDPDADTRAAVAKNVGSIGWNDGIRNAVIGAMKDAFASVRRGAAEGLGGNRNDAAVVAALRSGVQDPDLDVRARVLRSLGHSGEAATAAMADIVASLRDREGKVRVAALEAVRERRFADKRTVRESIRCLDDADYKVQLAALQAVAGQQQAAGAALSRIVTLTGHARGAVRRRALAAAWAVADARQCGAIALRSVEALLDDDKKAAGSARQLLQQFVDRKRGE